jgi:hypothetical protein
MAVEHAVEGDLDPSLDACTLCPRASSSARAIPQIECWYRGWYLAAVASARKVTVELPADLLRRAQRSTGEGVTATIRRGLELVAASRTYDELRRSRGAVKLSIDWRRLREDRR